MSETELQELSRKAAGCLPKNWLIASAYVHASPRSMGMITRDIGDCFWLHESTEACTEIMVRVLWPADWDLVGNSLQVEWSSPTDQGLFDAMPVGSDPMLAFRIAVLRALVALKT